MSISSRIEDGSFSGEGDSTVAVCFSGSIPDLFKYKIENILIVL
jgi:hypothetical protein